MKSFTVFKLIMVIKKKLQLNYAAEDKFLHLGYCEYPTFGSEDPSKSGQNML